MYLRPVRFENACQLNEDHGAELTKLYPPDTEVARSFHTYKVRQFSRMICKLGGHHHTTAQGQPFVHALSWFGLLFAFAVCTLYKLKQHGIFEVVTSTHSNARCAIALRMQKQELMLIRYGLQIRGVPDPENNSLYFPHKVPSYVSQSEEAPVVTLVRRFRDLGSPIFWSGIPCREVHPLWTGADQSARR